MFQKRGLGTSVVRQFTCEALQSLPDPQMGACAAGVGWHFGEAVNDVGERHTPYVGGCCWFRLPGRAEQGVPYRQVVGGCVGCLTGVTCMLCSGE